MVNNKTNTNQPEDTLRDRDLKATIWRNEGEKGPYFTVTVAKTYKDENGKYHDTNNFTGTDLLRLAELSREAYRVTNDMTREHFQSLEQGQDGRRYQGQTKTDAGEPARGEAAESFDQSASERQSRTRSYSR